MLPKPEQLATLSAVLEHDLKAITKLNSQLENLLVNLHKFFGMKCLPLGTKLESKSSDLGTRRVQI